MCGGAFLYHPSPHMGSAVVLQTAVAHVLKSARNLEENNCANHVTSLRHSQNTANTMNIVESSESHHVDLVQIYIIPFELKVLLNMGKNKSGKRLVNDKS
ncbi:hypothetical protein B566_EDAN015026 [Ephemera danica]|nr:hypothetical protein B566_EDAN015026 [Ephemera danica]